MAFGKNIARMVQRAVNPASRAVTPTPAAAPVTPPPASSGGRGFGRGIMGAIRRATGRGFAGGGSVGSASKRADGCAQRGKTKGKII